MLPAVKGSGERKKIAGKMGAAAADIDCFELDPENPYPLYARIHEYALLMCSLQQAKGSSGE